MDVTQIADTSVALSLTNTQSDAGMLILKSSLDFQQTASENLIQSMTASAPSNHILDVLV